MMKILVVLAATALAGSALADDKGASDTNSTPGHQMQKDRASGKDVDKGASSYSPGHKMQDDKAAGKDVDRGASSYTPPRNDSGSTGGSTGE